MLVEEFSKFNERVLGNDGTKWIISRKKERRHGETAGTPDGGD
jgi:hypothetical protein